MRIAITTVQIPFVRGGAEYLAENLRRELTLRGHEAEIITVPFFDYPPHQVENQIVASRLYDLSCSWAGTIDLCIGLRFPAYFIPHPNKVVWALHQYRQVYDLFDTAYSSLKSDPTGLKIKSIVTKSDQVYLPEAKRLYTISQNVSKRMMVYSQLLAMPLYHPCPDMEKFYSLPAEDYILMPSRINATKRQSLAVEAMQYVKSDIRLLLLGGADNEEILSALQADIRKYHVEDKVRLVGFVSPEEKLKLYAKTRAVLFIPKDEDYGYITLEAMAASRPVITVKDSGGPIEFVLDDQTGLITEPSPLEIAGAIDRIASSRFLGPEMGKAGRKHLDDMNISWDHVVKELTK